MTSAFVLSFETICLYRARKWGLKNWFEEHIKFNSFCSILPVYIRHFKKKCFTCVKPSCKPNHKLEKVLAISFFFLHFTLVLEASNAKWIKHTHVRSIRNTCLLVTRLKLEHHCEGSNELNNKKKNQWKQKTMMAIKKHSKQNKTKNGPDRYNIPLF